METLALAEAALAEAQTARRQELLDAYEAFQKRDSDAIVPITLAIQERYDISFVQATDIVFDALWLAGQAINRERRALYEG